MRITMEVMRFKVTFDRETDGRWIAEVDELGVLVYGTTREIIADAASYEGADVAEKALEDR